MRAAVAREFGKPLEFDDRVVPLPHGFEALVRVEYTGVCHTDLHAVGGDWPVKPALPFVPGHEGVGRVVAVGHEVTSLKVGDRVGNAWLWSACGECEYCTSGRETLCPVQRNSGYTVDGSFQDYMLVDSRYAARIPESLDPARVAPILCAGVTVYKGLKTTGARPGQWVVVSGIGGLGHLAVEYAVAMGLDVVAVDVADSKLVLARELGATFTVNAAKTDAAAEIQREIGGAHGVLVTAPSEAAVAQAVRMARRGGTISLVGLPSGTFPVSVFDTVLNGLTIKGSIVGTRGDLAEALDLAARGKVHATVTKHPFADVNRVLDDMRDGRILGRVVLELAGDLAREEAGYPTRQFANA
ncbi:alcohol dehydrogenase AdhP [Gryllotalpicola protaetiae]|uniref:Alcohol dehydrogenase n=1 Tax=Gryllotalpicola protaetiae TaxID=2419771 RepID=A0A387BNH7_9MICO|nr:alcohol dehydrogenase AdhP [Gryllotalpicola protaetiae]AYG02547.1 alcohol dehydrogenase AdhP [Gryllotalpicola protaetiae]